MSIKLVVGLGNPGEAYAKHRHNVGFMFINHCIKLSNEPSKKASLKSHIYRTIVNDQSLIFIKPQTFMNDSGVAVQLVLNYFKLEPENMCVVYDDFDVPFGDIRLRKSGGAGTHNGMKSIIQHCGTNNFPRLRIGIGPKKEYLSASDFVLQSFSKDEQIELPGLLSEKANQLLTHLDKSVDNLMNILNVTVEK